MSIFLMYVINWVRLYSGAKKKPAARFLLKDISSVFCRGFVILNKYFSTKSINTFCSSCLQKALFTDVNLYMRRKENWRINGNV